MLSQSVLRTPSNHSLYTSNAGVVQRDTYTAESHLPLADGEIMRLLSGILSSMFLHNNEQRDSIAKTKNINRPKLEASKRDPNEEVMALGKQNILATTIHIWKYAKEWRRNIAHRFKRRKI